MGCRQRLSPITRKIRYFGSAGTPRTPPSGPTPRYPEPRKCIRWFGTPLHGCPDPLRPTNNARLSPELVPGGARGTRHAATFLAVLSSCPVDVVLYACSALARPLSRPSSCNSVPRRCPTPVPVAGVHAARGARPRTRPPGLTGAGAAAGAARGGPDCPRWAALHLPVCGVCRPAVATKCFLSACQTPAAQCVQRRLPAGSPACALHLVPWACAPWRRRVLSWAWRMGRGTLFERPVGWGCCAAY